MWKPIETVKSFFGNRSKPLTHSDDFNFEEVMKSELFGRRIVRVQGAEGDGDAYLYLDNGRRLRLVGNEGCGGCGNGWYNLKNINVFDNAITNVQLDVDCDDTDCDVYKLFVLSGDQRMNVVSFEGYDNGYYGTGFEVFVQVEQNGDELNERN